MVTKFVFEFMKQERLNFFEEEFWVNIIVIIRILLSQMVIEKRDEIFISFTIDYK